MAEESTPPIRLMNFVSEEQLDESKKSRGERVEDGTFQRDKTLYEILKENKDKKDAEFNERFKHRPPKALDEDETEFLEKIEMTKRDYERQVADEEAEELRSFQAAVAAQSAIIHEPKETPPAPTTQVLQEQKSTGKRNTAARPLNMIIKVKPQPKKAKVGNDESRKGSSENKKVSSSEIQKFAGDAAAKASNGDIESNPDAAKIGLGLVSYSDESEDD